MSLQGYQPNFFQIATKMSTMGGYVIPVTPGSKKCTMPEWQNRATKDLRQIEAWHEENPHYNCAIVGKPEVGALWGFDDDDNILAEYESIHGAVKTYRVQTCSGNTQLLFKHNQTSINAGNLTLENDEGQELFSARMNNRYVISAGSVAHPDNDPAKELTAYEATDLTLPIEAPDTFIQFLQTKAKSTKLKTTPLDVKTGQVVEGGRNNYLTSRLGTIHQAGVVMPELLATGEKINEEVCVPPVSAQELRTICESINRYPIVPGGEGSVLLGGVPVGQPPIVDTLTQLTPEEEDKIREKAAADFLEAYEKGVEPHTHYVMTKEEFDQECNKEFPVFPRAKQPGPAWDDSILYGDAGKLIKKASAYNESHPAGMLVDFLVSLGSIIGRGPHFKIGATTHYTNEFMVRVGSSSTSRKGTGRNAIDEVLRLVDYDWYLEHIASGFGSSEAIINRIRDGHVDRHLVKGVFEPLVVPGVLDKRLCIREGEMANILVLAAKPESHTDAVLRDAWDGQPLRNEVKGKSREGISNTAKCELPHVSISSDTTVSELCAKMPAGASENGFGNRFLYVYVYRVKDCPQGSPDIDWSQEVVNFKLIVKTAKAVGRMPMTQSARNYWNKTYSEFEHDGQDGLAGKMTARASAHIRRIAMIYALIDFADETDLIHFQAAERLWNYCSESALYIFSGLTREQQKITQWIDSRGPATFNQIRDKLYQRNKLVGWIRAEVDAMVKTGKLLFKNDMYATPMHMGKLLSR